MKVVLATPPEFRRLTTPAQVLGPPIGHLYLAACLRERFGQSNSDIQVRVFDAFTLALAKERFVEHIAAERPDILGVTVTSRMFPVTITALKELSKRLPEMKIVVGGIHPTFLAREILTSFPFVHYAIKGEAERSFPDLVARISANESASDVMGVSCFEDRKFIDNPADTIQDLDSLPFPARDTVSDVRYGYTWNGIDLTYGKFTSIVTSRGCPFTCNFCTNWIFSNRRARLRSIPNVLDEMEQLSDEGYNSCVIIDDIFTLNQKRVMEMCKGIRERKIDLVFYCEGRVDSQSPEMFAAMKAAGFSSILFGIESGSQRVLDYFHKGTTPAKARSAVKTAKEAGLKTIGAFIVGAPVETSEDFQATLRHIRELGLDGLEVNALSTAPWDPRSEQLKSEGRVGEWDWLTDHLMSSYFPEHSRNEIARLVEESYYAFFRIGLRGNARKLGRYILHDRDARNAILKNLANPHAWRLVREGGKARHKIEEVLLPEYPLDLQSLSPRPPAGVLRLDVA